MPFKAVLTDPRSSDGPRDELMVALLETRRNFDVTWDYSEVATKIRLRRDDLEDRGIVGLFKESVALVERWSRRAASPEL